MNIAELLAAPILSGAEFAYLLNSVGLTQRQFARLGHYAPGSVNRWCSGTRKDRAPAPGAAIALAVCFGLVADKQQRAIKAVLGPSHDA